MLSHNNKDVDVKIQGKIGIIKFNQPKALNAFSDSLKLETIQALRELDDHPDTVFTVLTGEGRFFSAGADVRQKPKESPTPSGAAEQKVSQMIRLAPLMEMMRAVIDHKKVFVLALNGPGIGGGAAWFQGVADIVLASTTAYLQVPFSALGLVPEAGASTNLARHMGVHRANDFLMFGRKLDAHELEAWGLLNRVFPSENFHQSVIQFLEDQLQVNDGKSMMEAKRLQNLPLRSERILAVYNACDALAERFVEGTPTRRLIAKQKELEEARGYTAKSKARL
ncbi:ClpP/crotonase-like domain-containing protein [Aspergillus unguis]